MKSELKNMPFSIDLAKKITEGKIKGAKIITKEGDSVRILAFDIKDTYPIVAAILKDGGEFIRKYDNKGTSLYNISDWQNLLLLVPIYYFDLTTFTPQKWQSVLVRKRNNDTWFARVASGTNNEMGYGVVSIPNKEAFYSQCLPINKVTIKLLGTTKSYSELMEE